MGVAKKYRGKYAKCLANYVKDRLDGRDDLDDGILFITHTGVSDECHEAVMEAVSTYGHFHKVYETLAGCTLPCHCGPRHPTGHSFRPEKVSCNRVIY